MSQDIKGVIYFIIKFLLICLLPLITNIPFILYDYFEQLKLYCHTHETICLWFAIFMIVAPFLLQLSFLIYMGVWLVKKCKNPYLEKLVTTWELPLITFSLLFIADLIILFNISEIAQFFYFPLLASTKNFIIMYISLLITKFLQSITSEQKLQK